MLPGLLYPHPHFYSHFLEEQTEAQSGYETYLDSQSTVEQGIEPSVLSLSPVELFLVNLLNC